MAITLDSLALPPDLVWTDEFKWTPVFQEIDHALDGTLIVQTGVAGKGRPITLAGDGGSGWIARGDLLALYALAQNPGPFALSLHDGRTFSVEFRRSDQPIDAAPVVDYSNPGPEDWYTLVVRLMEV